MCQGRNKKVIRNHFELTKNTIYQNQWDVTKAGIQEKCLTPNTYVRNTERSQINDLGNWQKEHIKLELRRKTTIKITVENF